MSLKTLMASDLQSTFVNQDEFAESGTYKPQDAATGFPLVLTPGDVTPASRQGDGGMGQQGSTPFTCVRSAFDAGMTLVGLTGKLPVRGDTYTIAAGDLAGKWYVDTWSSDVGGALILSLSRPDWFDVSADGVRAT